jgi:hypothetical protein
MERNIFQVQQQYAFLKFTPFKAEDRELGKIAEE